MMDVAKLYDRLDAKERTSALLVAWVRGNELDAQRLNATVPRQTERRLMRSGRQRRKGVGE